MVYLRGCAGHSDGSNLASGDTFFTMPSNARPPTGTWPTFIAAASQSSSTSGVTWWRMVQINWSNGAFSPYGMGGSGWAGGTTDHLCFHGISWSTAAV